MKKILLATFATMLMMFSYQAQAQDYNYAAGLSLGGNIGINFKAKLSHPTAVEAGLDFTLSHNAVNLYAVWQYHIGLATGFYAYLGAGANIGVSSCDGNNFNLGLDPNIGLEYKFASAPIAIGVDYRPSINIIGCSLYGNGSLKLRYTF